MVDKQTKKSSPRKKAARKSDCGVGCHLPCFDDKYKFKKSNNNFTIHYANVEGLRANIDCAHQHLESRKPDILVLTETQVKKDAYENNFYFKNYQFEQSFELHRGICVFIKNNVPYSRHAKYEIFTNTAQTIVLKVPFKNKKFIYLIGLYRSPNQTDAQTMDFFETLTYKCDEIRAKYPSDELVVVGDFNTHHREWLKHPYDTNEAGIHAKLFTDSHDLTQIVSGSTFACSNSRGIHTLDLCLTSIPHAMEAQVESGIGGSKHHLVATNILIEAPTTIKQQPRRLWHFKRGDYNGLRSFFQGFPWEKSCLYNNNIDDAVKNFTETVLHGMNKFIPSSIHKDKSKNKFSTEASKAAKRSRTAHRKFKKKEISFDDYKAVRNKCKKICDRDAKKADKRKAEKATQSSISDRNFYQLVASVANSENKSSLPPLQRADGALVVDPYEKADLLANVFASNSFISVPIGTTPPLLPFCGSQMKPLVITEEAVLRNLQTLKTNKSTGPDGIPARILKMFASELAPVLTKIFSLSYKSGVYPNAWKNAMVQPVPKHGDKTDPTNYRPISILSVVAKVFEKCINEHIVQYLKRNKIISDKQYGFRECRSTGDLLTYVINKINSALEHHGEAYAIALDISKAFDKVWHENLINKIVAYGFDSALIAWIKSFLKDRVISVMIDGCSSSQHILHAGVPQGSVLSPTLFLLYINDLLEKTVNPIHSFADDSTLHCSISFVKPPSAEDLNINRQHVVDSLNSDLSTIFEWGEKNLVKFNEKKTQLCTFTRKRSSNENQIKVNDHVLENCNTLRLLGVNVSSNIKWNEHVMALVKSAAKKLGFLNRCRKFFNSHQVLHIYKTYIRPCLEYCCQVWGGAATTTLKLLDRVQRRAVRIIRNPRLTSQLDSLQHRREVADLCVYYKYFNGKCSDELKNVIPPLAIPTRSTRASTNAHRYIVERRTPRSVDYAGDFFVRTAAKWNVLPDTVFPSNYNMAKFKKAVNDFLIKCKCAKECSGSARSTRN